MTTTRYVGDPLAPMPMSPAEVADLVRRVQAKTTPRSLAASRGTAVRWAKYRCDREATP